jgi:hypothetical protein
MNDIIYIFDYYNLDYKVIVIDQKSDLCLLDYNEIYNKDNYIYGEYFSYLQFNLDQSIVKTTDLMSNLLEDLLWMLNE